MKKQERVASLSEKSGLPPGSLVYVGGETQVKTFITVMDYDGHELEEHLVEGPDQCYPFKNSHTISWINVDGLQNVNIIGQIGQHFGLDALLLEDVLNTEQRPKVEVFDECLFFTLKMLSYDKKTRKIDTEQVSFVLGRNYVLSFQERHGDVFEPVRQRLRNNWGSIRHQSTDYLVYALIDVVVDNYFIILEALGEELEEVEDAAFAESKNNPEIMSIIQQNKRQTQMLQRSIYPLREAISKIQRNESNLIQKRNIRYFDDVRDHTIQVIENIDSYHDINIGVQEVYLSSLSHKMNQVIQVLTIISTLFIPLTFIVGVYGMNFHYMPELNWRYGYWVVWGIMGAVVMGLLVFFRRRGWI